MVYDGTVFTCLPAWAHVWLSGPAVYVLCRRELGGRVSLLHIGETADLDTGIGAGHPTWDAALQLGMSEIHIHALAGGEAERRALAARLRKRHATPLDPLCGTGANPVHREQARLAAAFAPRTWRMPTLLDWVEAMMVAPTSAEPAAAAPRPALPRLMHGLARRAAGQH
jgi:hypothetical protein